jgi:hypothetical protein
MTIVVDHSDNYYESVSGGNDVLKYTKATSGDSIVLGLGFLQELDSVEDRRLTGAEIPVLEDPAFASTRYAE